jgi:hypothetical protein
VHVLYKQQLQNKKMRKKTGQLPNRENSSYDILCDCSIISGNYLILNTYDYIVPDYNSVPKQSHCEKISNDWMDKLQKLLIEHFQIAYLRTFT